MIIPAQTCLWEPNDLKQIPLGSVETTGLQSKFVSLWLPHNYATFRALERKHFHSDDEVKESVQDSTTIFLKERNRPPAVAILPMLQRQWRFLLISNKYIDFIQLVHFSMGKPYNLDVQFLVSITSDII